MNERLPLLTLLTLGIVALLLAAPAAAQRFEGPDAGALRARLSADGELAAINDLVPGFGGMFVGSDGVLHVYMKSENAFWARPLFGPGVRVLDADFEFRQLLGWRDTLRGLLDTPGLATLDADEGANRVRVGLETGAPASLRERLVARLDELGVPRNAVVFEDVEPIYPVQTLRDAFDPVPAGVEIHWSNFLCTLGFNVARVPSSDLQDACFFVTNDHCTDVQGQVTGTTYRQPAFGTQIAVEVLDPPFFSGGPCPAGRVCRYSDAALARYDGPVGCDFGTIARTTGLGSITIDPAVPRWDIVRKLQSVSVGHVVAKVGRTTGWTEGPVVQTCVDTNVANSNITRLCQSTVTAGVGGGDSGSPVFLRRVESSLAALVGILWGGNGAGTLFVFSPVENIEAEFGFSLTVH